MNLDILNIKIFGENNNEYYECKDNTLLKIISDKLLSHLILLNSWLYSDVKIKVFNSSINNLKLFNKLSPDYINKIVRANKHCFFNCDSILFFYNKEHNIYIYYKHLSLLDYIPIKELKKHCINVEYIFNNNYMVFNVLSLYSIILNYEYMNNNILDDIKKIYANEPYINIYKTDYDFFIKNFKENIKFISYKNVQKNL